MALWSNNNNNNFGCNNAKATIPLLDAIVFATEKHASQRRKNAAADPYIIHPLRVAQLLANVGGYADDVELLEAAVLHDTLEDTATTMDELSRRFGPRVAMLVAQVSDDKSASKVERKRAQIQRVASGLIDHRACLIKLADKLDNCTDLLRGAVPSTWTTEQVHGYAAWSWVVLKQLRARKTNAQLEQRLEEVLRSLLASASIDPSMEPKKLEECLQNYYNKIEHKLF